MPLYPFTSTLLESFGFGPRWFPLAGHDIYGRYAAGGFPVKKNTVLFKKKTNIRVQPKRPAVPGSTLNNSSNNATVKSIVALNLGRNLDMIRDVINNAIISKANISFVSLNTFHLSCCPWHRPCPCCAALKSTEILLTMTSPSYKCGLNC